MKVAGHEIGNIVAQWNQGACRVKIADGAFVAKDKNDPKVKKIMSSVTQKAWRIVEAARAEGRDI